MVEIKHLCLCLLFSSTHFSVYKDTFAFYKDTKCVQGHAILMPAWQCQIAQVLEWVYVGRARGHFEEKTDVEMTERGIIRRMLN